MKLFQLMWFLPISLFISLFIVSCSQNEIYSSLKTAEDIINDNPDSTLSILREIDYEALENDHLKALYGLLYTSAIYKTKEVLNSDSIINYSIDIFENNDDPYHLADAYYYKGAMNFSRGQLQISTISLKKAEKIAVEEGYDLITNKVYELLSFVNYVSENKDLTLEYTKKFLDSSVLLKDQALIVRALVMVASSYAGVNMADSAYTYITKGLQHIDDSDSLLRADILVNVGEMYFEKGELKYSADYALESDSIYSNPHAKMLLGKIEYERGDSLKAMKYWEEALSITDNKLKRKLYKMLSKYYAEIGQYDNAFIIVSKLDSLNENANSNSKTVQELQLQFDRVKSESELYRKVVYLLVIAFITSIAFLLFLRYYQKRVKSYNFTINTLTNKNDTYKSEIENFSEKVNMYQHEIGLYVSKISNFEEEISKNIEKIKTLKTSDRSKQKEIDELKDNISTLYKSIMSELQKGNTIYETIKNRKPIVHYSDEDLNSLVDFYKIINNKVFSGWLERYTPLSVRQYVFLILEDLGYDDYDIADVLGVSDTTVRSTRSRIKKKMRL